MAVSFVSFSLDASKTAKIQMDMLSTFWQLDQIEKGLSFCENMVNIVEVYNENVSYLNEHIQKDLREEAVCNYNLPSPAGSIVADHCNTLTKLADVSLLLKEKITEVYNKITSKNGPSEKLLELKFVQPDTNSGKYRPCVRSSDAEIARRKASIDAELTEINRLKSIIEATQAEIKKAQTERAAAEDTNSIQNTSAPQTTAVTASVSVQSNVEYGYDLGVCAEPDWDNKPIEFRYEGSGWKGEVPLDKKFKFVVLQNRKVLKWEDHENRTLGHDHSFYNRSGSYQVQF